VGFFVVVFVVLSIAFDASKHYDAIDLSHSLIPMMQYFLYLLSAVV